MPLGLRVDVPELGIAVGMLSAFLDLGVALQAEALLAQQPRDGIGAYRMTLSAELAGQHPRGLDRPAQRRHRVAALLRLYQRQECRHQPRIRLSRLLATPTRSAHPSQRRASRLQFGDPGRDRALAHPRSFGHHPNFAMAQRTRLCPRSQTALTLIEMREQRRGLRREQYLGTLWDRRSTSSCPVSGTHGLFPAIPNHSRSTTLEPGSTDDYVSGTGVVHP